jgi:hypothetical protein
MKIAGLFFIKVQAQRQILHPNGMKYFVKTAV